jgi:hypothetical protein
VVTKPTAFEESAQVMRSCSRWLARAEARGGADLPLARQSKARWWWMEATGHYWQNLFAALVAKAFGSRGATGHSQTEPNQDEEEIPIFNPKAARRY